MPREEVARIGVNQIGKKKEERNVGVYVTGTNGTRLQPNVNFNNQNQGIGREETRNIGINNVMSKDIPSNNRIKVNQEVRKKPQIFSNEIKPNMARQNPFYKNSQQASL